MSAHDQEIKNLEVSMPGKSALVDDPSRTGKRPRRETNRYSPEDKHIHQRSFFDGDDHQHKYVTDDCHVQKSLQVQNHSHM
jgi:hypothetical protein